MEYSVACGCGNMRRVTAGDAGSSLTCSCGQQIEVPPLSILRREAGQFSASPELIIKTMIEKNELPEDSTCVQCHSETNGVHQFMVVCERAETKREVGGCSFVAYFILLGWVGVILATLQNRNHSKDYGRDVSFRLPIRLCPACEHNRNRSEVKELLCRVPVYAHLLAKYPHSRITDA